MKFDPNRMPDSVEDMDMDSVVTNVRFEPVEAVDVVTAQWAQMLRVTWKFYGGNTVVMLVGYSIRPALESMIRMIAERAVTE